MAHDDQFYSMYSGMGAFGSLALEAVSVVNARNNRHVANGFEPRVLGLLDQRLLSRAIFDPAETLDQLRRLQIDDAALIDYYIPNAARAIGEKWVRSELGFAEVTIASVRLQSLLTEVEFTNPRVEPAGDCPFNILVTSCHREQHTLGCFVLSAQLRRRGAAVDIVCGEPNDVVKSHVLSGEYDAVLFSCSRSQDLETIFEIVNLSRGSMALPPVFALGGIVVGSMSSIDRLTGVDLVADDVETVVTFCAQNLTQEQQRARR